MQIHVLTSRTLHLIVQKKIQGKPMKNMYFKIHASSFIHSSTLSWFHCHSFQKQNKFFLYLLVLVQTTVLNQVTERSYTQVSKASGIHDKQFLIKKSPCFSISNLINHLSGTFSLSLTCGPTFDQHFKAYMLWIDK